MHHNEILGLDVGRRRTGIARASSVARIAEPLSTVETENLKDVLQSLIAQNGVSAIVIGLPRNLNGDDTEQTGWVRDWLKNFKVGFNVDFFWQDEALTTSQSEKQVVKNSLGVDAYAAAVILDDFLKSDEKDRQKC